VQWVVLAYLLSITALIVSVGRFGDIIGRRRLLLAGISLFSAASILCAVAPNLWWLIASRAIQGIGAAIIMALTMALMGEVVPKEKMGSAMGLLGTMLAIGTSLGPNLGGVLIAELGWQSMFLINVPLGVLAIMLAYRFLPSDRRETNVTVAGFDSLWALVLVLTLLVYAFAMTLGRGTFGLLNTVFLMLVAFGVGLFFFVENKTLSPLVRLVMFRNPVLTAGFVMSVLVTTVVMATTVVVPSYLSGGLVLSAASVGLVTIATGMRITLAVAAALIVIALAIGAISQMVSRRVMAPSQEEGSRRGFK
ncbi:MFS transporter, partial [Pseudomonas sp. HMWF031]